MSKPKLWRTLEELNADHERLCAEVEELKKQFEEHTHRYTASYASPYTEMETKQPSNK